MDFMQYITEQGLVMIPVLFLIGMMLKNTEYVADKWIPIVLLPLGILGCWGIMGAGNREAWTQVIIQGVLVTGAAVYGNQLIKQVKKE